MTANACIKVDDEAEFFLGAGGQCGHDLASAFIFIGLGLGFYPRPRSFLGKMKGHGLDFHFNLMGLSDGGFIGGHCRLASMAASCFSILTRKIEPSGLACDRIRI